jgi:hypothetical protein
MKILLTVLTLIPMIPFCMLWVLTDGLAWVFTKLAWLSEKIIDGAIWIVTDVIKYPVPFANDPEKRK